MYRRSTNTNNNNNITGANNNNNHINTLSTIDSSSNSFNNNNQSFVIVTNSVGGSSSSLTHSSSTSSLTALNPPPPSSSLKMSTMVMSSRDRTTEFHSIVRSNQSRSANNPQQQLLNSNNTPNGVKTKNKDLIQQRHQFMMIAKTIGKGLTKTCIDLENLTNLAKKRSLFDDKHKEIQDLTFTIKQDINNLHSEITRLQEFLKVSQNNETNNMKKHSNSVVYCLQSRLQSMSKEFKQVLEVRNENLKQQSERGEQYFSKNTLNPSSAASLFSPPKMPGSSMGKSVLIYDSSNGQQQLNSYTNSNNSNNTNKGEETILNMDLIQKQQMQKRLILNEEETFIRDRANAMQLVEQTIVELGTMFHQLATMIKEQEEQIQRIDSNIDDVDINVSQAHSELLKYFQSVTSNRWLMIKIFLVLIVFFVVFIVVMA